MYDILQKCISARRLSDEKVIELVNVLLMMVNEYHTTCLVHAANCVSLIVPEELKEPLHPLGYYTPVDSQGRETEKDLCCHETAHTL